MTLVRNSRPMRAFPLRFLLGASFGAALATMTVGLPLGFTLAWAALAPVSFNDSLRNALNVIDPVAPLLEENWLRRLDADPGFAGFPSPVRSVGDQLEQSPVPPVLALAEERKDASVHQPVPGN